MSTSEQDEHLSRESLAGVYRRYSCELMVYANSFLKNTDDSQEIVQDLFCSLNESLPDRKIRTSTLRSYLYVSVRNRSFNLLQRAKKSTAMPEEQAAEDTQYGRIDDRLTGETICSYVRENCSPQQQEIFNLRIAHSLTWHEISEITNIPLSSAYREFDLIISEIKRIFPDVF